VLYPNSEKEEVNNFIKNELSKYCQNNQFIFDNLGFGAKKL